MPAPHTRAAIYVVGAEIEDQIRACRDFAAAQHADVVATLIDDAETAHSALGDDNLVVLREMAKRGEIGTIVIASLLQLGISVDDGEVMLRQLLEGTGVLCLTADGMATFGPIEDAAVAD